MLKAIDRGFFQREIADAAYVYQKEIDRMDRTIIGINDHLLDEPIEIPILKMDEEGERRQVSRLDTLRRERDNVRVEKALDRLRRIAEGEENTMPAILECARSHATLGDICGVLRDVFGEYIEPSIF